MKTKLYEALKEFENRLRKTFKNSSFQLIEPFEGNDVGVFVTLPSQITNEERKKLSDIAASIEEEYDVYLGILTRKAA